MSAKVRVTLWVTLMMLILAGLTMIFVLIGNSSAFINDPERRLASVVNRNVNDVDFDKDEIDLGGIDTFDDGIYVACYDVGKNCLKGETYDNVTLNTKFTDGAIQQEDVDGITYIIYDEYVPGPNEVDGIWVRGTTSELDDFDVKKTIIILMCIFLPLLTVLAAIGGWFIAWITLRPVTKITKAAASITDGNDLSLRINVKHGAPEMKKLASTINNMIKRLEKSFESEKQFTSDASHELRTPITVIAAECGRAKRKAQTKEDFDKTIDIISRNTKRMSDLTESLLHLTRLQQGTDKYRKKYANFSEFLSLACEDLASKKEKGITLTTDIDPDITFTFDLTLMSRLIDNLVVNAFRYGKQNGHIIVSLKQSDGKVFLSVKDDGIGIDEYDLDKIWQRFWQADSSRTGSGGSGLGLAMVKEIAEYHGGTIDVKSRLGEGSEFIITFTQ